MKADIIPVRQPQPNAVMESLENRQLLSVVFGLQAKNALIAFDSATPGTVLATIRVKGLQRGETLRGIDFRPATNQLYGLGTTDRLYTIDTTSGAATAVGTSTLAVPLDINQEIGFDFNPVPDRLRIVTESNQNLRVNPNDGIVVDADTNAPGTQFDGLLTYDAGDANAGQNPALVGVAYTNNDSDAGTLTTLFGIDSERDVLVRQGSPEGTPISPNAGTLFTVGALGVDVLPEGGFDVFTSGSTNTAFAALRTSARTPSQLYTINLDSGAATAIGNIGRGRKPVLALAAAPAGRSFFVVTSRNELLGLNTATPAFIVSKTPITGLSSRREKVVGIDFRPSTGQLWALTDAERLYTIDTSTGAAASISTTSAIPLTDRAAFGFDFNPAADLIRVTNSAGQNIRFDPVTGTVVDFDTASPAIDADTGLAYVPGDANAGATPRIVASAYTNNIGGGTPTTLFDIDSGRDALVRQGSAGGTVTSPNTGQLFTVGATTVNVPDQAGFDIVTTSGNDEAFAVFAPGGRGTTGLFSVNLTTGVMTLVSNLNKRVKAIAGFAVQTGP
jgi:hypothetical protein